MQKGNTFGQQVMNQCKKNSHFNSRPCSSTHSSAQFHDLLTKIIYRKREGNLRCCFLMDFQQQKLEQQLLSFFSVWPEISKLLSNCSPLLLSLLSCPFFLPKLSVYPSRSFLLLFFSVFPDPKALYSPPSFFFSLWIFQPLLSLYLSTPSRFLFSSPNQPPFHLSL